MRARVCIWVCVRLCARMCVCRRVRICMRVCISVCVWQLANIFLGDPASRPSSTELQQLNPAADTTVICNQTPPVPPTTPQPTVATSRQFDKCVAAISSKLLCSLPVVCPPSQPQTSVFPKASIVLTKADCFGLHNLLVFYCSCRCCL